MTAQGDEPIYDVAVVGAGPAGATTAWYLARSGRRVLLLEKKRFPRDKICGDAVCFNALVHLERMEVLQALLAESKGHVTGLGGFVSPNGTGFLGDSGAEVGRPYVVAIKREILDERIARAAVSAGAELHEDTTVDGARLSDGLWKISAMEGGKATPFRARALVAADGALSRLTRALGIPTPPPDAVCSRAYVKAGTHRFTADGVMFYTSELIPGYAAIFREADGDLNFCTYLIPGGQCTNDDLHRLHHELIEHHPQIRAAIGPNAQIEKMRGAPLRLGGVRKSYRDHLLIVGDAAGHIDPLTGEGIHHAMDAAELAARTLDEALSRGNLSARALRIYQDRWMKAFGRDFLWSKAMVKAFTRFPILLDASAAAMQREGMEALVAWGKAMTGQAPKHTFLKPRLLWPIVRETTLAIARRARAQSRPGRVVAYRERQGQPFDFAHAGASQPE